MLFNLSQLKQLPLEEKLKLIKELELSIVAEEQAAYGIQDDIDEEESPEVVAFLEERFARIKNGETKMHPVKEVEMELRQVIETRKKRSV